jgi:hypothetical protein
MIKRRLLGIWDLSLAWYGEAPPSAPSSTVCSGCPRPREGKSPRVEQQLLVYLLMLIRSYGELDILFENKVPAWRFKKTKVDRAY